MKLSPLIFCVRPECIFFLVASYLYPDEAMLRKRIQELQHYRRMGLTTAADIDKYEQDCQKRVRSFLFYITLTHGNTNCFN